MLVRRIWLFISLYVPFFLLTFKHIFACMMMMYDVCDFLILAVDPILCFGLSVTHFVLQYCWVLGSQSCCGHSAGGAYLSRGPTSLYAYPGSSGWHQTPASATSLPRDGTEGGPSDTHWPHSSLCWSHGYQDCQITCQGEKKAFCRNEHQDYQIKYI